MGRLIPAAPGGVSVRPTPPISIPQPGLSARVVSTTQINWTASYVPPPSLATYTFQFAPSLAALASAPLIVQASPTYPQTGLTPATPYWGRVNIQTSETPSRTSSWSAVATVTTNPVVITGAVKFNGGHYSWHGSGGWVGRANNLSTQISDAQAQTSGTGWAGVKFAGYPEFYEGDTQGDISAAKAAINALLTACAAVNPPQRVILEYEDRSYGSPTGVVPTSYPLYMRNAGLIDPGTAGSGNSVASSVKWWTTAGMDAIINVWQLLGAVYDTHPLVEMICPLEESAYSNIGNSFSVSGGLAQIKRLMAACSAEWPHTIVRFLINFLSNDSDMQGLMAYAATFPNVFIGGPDPEIPTGSATYPVNGPPPGNYPTNYRVIAGNYIFRGLSNSGNTSGGTDWRPTLGWVGEVQSLGIDLAGRSMSSPTLIAQYQRTVMNASYMCWDIATGNSGTQTAINAYVASQNSVAGHGLNTVPPTTMPVGFTPQYLKTFNGLTNAAPYNENSSTGYTTSGNGYGAFGSTAQKRNGRSSSMQLIIQSGTSGDNEFGSTTNGLWGYEAIIPTAIQPGIGTSIWFGMWIFYPTGFNPLTGDGYLKFIRIINSVSAQKTDVEIYNNGTSSQLGWFGSDENSGNGAQNPFFQSQAATVLLKQNQWNFVELQIIPTNIAGQMTLRFWCNGVFAFEMVNKTQKWINASGAVQSQTVTNGNYDLNSAGVLTNFDFATYWNPPYPSGDQHVFIDSIGMYVGPSSALPAADQFGNPMMGIGAF